MLGRGSPIGYLDFKAKSRRDSGFKVCAEGGLPKITLRIIYTKFWVGFTGLKISIGDPLRIDSLISPGLHYRSPVISPFRKLHLNSHLSWPLSNTPAI